MNNFITNLVHRHTSAEGNIKPRVRGMFEPEVYSSQIFHEYNFSEHKRSNGNPPSLATPVPRHFRAQPEEEIDTPREESFKISPSFVKSNINFSGDDEQKGKQHEASKSIIEPALNLSGEESQIKNIPTPVPDHEQDNVNRSQKTHKGKNYLVVSQENYLLDKKQHTFKKPTPDLSEEIVKPALVAALGDESADLQNTRTGSQELLGELAWLRNSKRVFNQDSLNKYLKAEMPPVIKVSIGRIDVRAISQPASSTIKSKATPSPKMSLEDYLNQRNKSEQ